MLQLGKQYLRFDLLVNQPGKGQKLLVMVIMKFHAVREWRRKTQRGFYERVSMKQTFISIVGLCNFFLKIIITGKRLIGSHSFPRRSHPLKYRLLLDAFFFIPVWLQILLKRLKSSMLPCKPTATPRPAPSMGGKTRLAGIRTGRWRPS